MEGPVPRRFGTDVFQVIGGGTVAAVPKQMKRGRARAKIRADGITPFLWFDDRAEEAARFYVSKFAGSKITSVTRGAEPGSSGRRRAIGVTFHLGGQEFFALNGGPNYQLSPAFSVFVSCRDQRDVDRLWEDLSEGGEKSRCGWLVDRYGLSWQIIPSRMIRLMADRNPEKAGRVVRAMLRMTKIDLAVLERAYRRD
jgi:predicted 3-demethylubiquinone-9 3-methyltransferase (glyoxalase superfamily)